MVNEQHILISLEERHAKNIFSGAKLVEFRTRPMNISSGTLVWIYVKLPAGEVVGRVRVRDVHCLPIAMLWKRFSAVSGLSRGEFFDYFRGVTNGFAISLEAPERLARSITLESMRKSYTQFQPPNFL